MKALDTNVLIRFLVKDDELQAKAVYKLFKQAESKTESFFIPILVVLETLWVLEAVYDTSRQEILDSIDELLLMPILEFEAQSAIRSFISLARENKTDLSDLLIAHHAKYSGCVPVITFNKRAAKLELFELLK
jgi:predicted nucleic-acid-binding protein